MECHPHILVANEPGAYRHLLATELPALCPRLRFLLVDPADLDAAVARFCPRLVICSRLTEAVRNHAAAAIVLYPDGADQVVIDAGDETWVFANPRLADLLAAIESVTDAARI